MRSDLAERPPLRLALAAAILAALGAGSACSADEYVAPPLAVASDAVDAGTAAVTLAGLAAAIEGDDPAGVEDLGADPDAVGLLRAMVDNAAGIGLADVSLTYVTETGRSVGDDGWEALVAVTWRVDGFDRAPAQTEVRVVFGDAGRTIVGLGDGGRVPVWLTGPVAVDRTRDAVVLGVVTPEELATHVRQTRVALEALRELLGGTPRLVVEVPADADALDRALGVSDGTYDAIAAVTAPVDGSRTPDSPVHVFVNPGVHDAMDAVAAQVVATHEAVHATTGAVLSQDAPLWLVEGFADYVALRDVDLPVSRTAGQLIDQVATSGVPDALPSDHQFATVATHLGAAYEAAWQVVVTLAARGGEEALVEFYRAVLDGADLATELAEGFGWTEADLTVAWQRRVAALG